MALTQPTGWQLRPIKMTQVSSGQMTQQSASHVSNVDLLELFSDNRTRLCVSDSADKLAVSTNGDVPSQRLSDESAVSLPRNQV